MLEKDFENAYISYQETQSPNEELIRKTLHRIEKEQASTPVVKPILRFSSIAACMVLLVAAFIAADFIGKGHTEKYVLPPDQTPPTLMASDSQSDTAAAGENVASDEVSDTASVPVSENNGDNESGSDKLACYLNTVTGLTDYNLPMISEEIHRLEYLTREEITTYLGRTIDPILPEGLSAVTPKEDQKWQFIYLRETDELFFDVCSFEYADKFDQDGLPTADARRLTITASKKGYRYGIYYADESPRVTKSYGIEVIFGQVKDQPIYSAEFKKDGVQYTVTGHRLTLTDINYVVKSLVS